MAVFFFTMDRSCLVLTLSTITILMDQDQDLDFVVVFFLVPP
jgi:hypothetical protein